MEVDVICQRRLQPFSRKLESDPKKSFAGSNIVVQTV